MKKYYIKTYGCQMNESDSERIAAILENKSYQPASKINKADLIIVNACSVRQSAIDRIFGLKSKFEKLKTHSSQLKTILTGCVLKSDKRKFEEFFDKVLDIKKLLGENYLSLQSKCKFPKSAFVPIMTGCDNFCSYCVVPYTRGREISRPAQKIINEIKGLIKKGYKEITLLGQNVNSYEGKVKNQKSTRPRPSRDEVGKVKSTNQKLKNTQNPKSITFPKLLRMINDIPGNFLIKFLTSHPKDMSDELIETIAGCQKVTKEIHLPIQSGDDEILKKMNRGYAVRQYKNLIKKIRQKIPNVKISTDVIVGFPGETKKQFKNTVKAFKKNKFDKAYIAKYSPRAGTAAAKLKDNVSPQEKKRRWKTLNDIVNKPRS